MTNLLFRVIRRLQLLAVIPAITLVTCPTSNQAANPLLVGRWPAYPGWDRAIAVQGDYAYVAGGTGLDLIDIRNPRALRWVGRADISGLASGVAVSGSYACVIAEESGLQVIDISNPKAPKRVGRILLGGVDGSGLASTLILANHYLPSGGIDNDNDGLIDSVIETQTIQFSRIEVQNNVVTMEWNAQAGARYRVQYKNTLSDPEWISLSDVTATGGTAAISDSVERITAARFYRIQLAP